MIVYCIRNLITGKAYIGQTRQPLSTRWKQHRTAAREGSVTPFHCALRGYGPDVFRPEIIAESDSQESLDELERMMISIFRAQESEFGYNLLPGGNERPVVLPEVRAKISATLTGRPVTDDFREACRKGQTGRKHSEESKRKCSEALKGKPKSEEHRRKLSEAAKRRGTFHFHSPESRAKAAAALKGRIVSEETRRKISESEKGKTISQEHRNAISTFWKGRKRAGLRGPAL